MKVVIVFVMVAILFFSAKREVFALLLAVLCEQSHDGYRLA